MASQVSKAYSLQILSYAVEWACSVILRSSSGWYTKSNRYIGYQILLISACTLLILFDEYRLTVNGLLYALSSLGLLGISRALYNTTNSEVLTTRPLNVLLEVGNRGLSLTLLMCLIVSGTWAFLEEDVYLSMTRWKDSNLLLLGVNVVSSAIALILGGSISSYTQPTQLSTDGPGCQFTDQDSGWRRVYTSCTSTFAILLAFPFVEHMFISPVQIIFFLVASIICTGVQRSHSNLLTMVFSVCGVRKDRLQNSPLVSAASIAMFIACTAVATMLWYGVAPSFLQRDDFVSGSQQAHLDFVYEPSHAFDIVVSMYREDPASVKHMISAIQDIPFISLLQPRVIIYTKDELADPPALRDATNATIVEKLENRGREGATYLHHMLSRRDSLAAHTLFIQADVHNSREFIYRLKSYFHSDTGMLSLGFSGVTCDCAACEDRWGWKDTYGLVPQIYQDVYNATCSRALISYKGQFIASARRIRGVEPRVYKYLLEGLTDPDSWAHSKEWLDKGPQGDDSLSAPFLGYSVERLWGILMQCSDMEVAWRCPSLLSGWRRGGSRRDCQCLDEVSTDGPTLG